MNRIPRPLIGVAVAAHSMIAVFALGVTGLVVCGVGLAIVARTDAARAARTFAVAAMVATATAALLTIAEAPLETWSLRFAADRPLANVAAALAALLILAAAGLSLALEPPPVADAGPAIDAARIRVHVRPSRARGSIAAHLALVVGAASAAAVRAQAGMSPADDEVRHVAANVRAGVAFLSDLDTDRLVAPVAPVVAAVSPIGVGALEAGCSIGLVLLAALATRSLPGHSRLVAMALVVVLPSVWSASLAVSVSAAALTAAVGLLDGRWSDPRPAIAGWCAGLALLADPTAAVGVAALVGTWALVPRRRLGGLASLLVPLLLAVAVSIGLVQATDRELDALWGAAGALPHRGGLWFALDAAGIAAVVVTAWRWRAEASAYWLLPLLALGTSQLRDPGSAPWGWSSALVAVAGGLAVCRRERRSDGCVRRRAEDGRRASAVDVDPRQD